MVTPYCNQGNLNQYVLSQNNKLPLKKIIEIISRITTAFLNLQEKNKDLNAFFDITIHTNLKPENILMHHDKAILADFGLSSFLRLEKQKDILFNVYKSPQQHMSKQAYSSKCDVWSMGIIAYELIFGKIETKDEDNIKNVWDAISKNLKKASLDTTNVQNLLHHMLCFEEKNRFDWEQVRDHKVFVNNS
jgi:serine/threonine protein kinase